MQRLQQTRGGDFSTVALVQKVDLWPLASQNTSCARNKAEFNLQDAKRQQKRSQKHASGRRFRRLPLFLRISIILYSNILEIDFLPRFRPFPFLAFDRQDFTFCLYECRTFFVMDKTLIHKYPVSRSKICTYYKTRTYRKMKARILVPVNTNTLMLITNSFIPKRTCSQCYISLRNCRFRLQTQALQPVVFRIVQ